MITIKIENSMANPGHPLVGDYVYTIRDKGTIVVDGKIEEHRRDLHPIVLLEKVVEDAKARLHERRRIK